MNIDERRRRSPSTSTPNASAQIAANLIENALKYATPKVEVYAAPQADGQIAIVVVDDGPGIPPDRMAHVFERLYTVRETPGRAVGTGLGLAIVRELAAAMGGQRPGRSRARRRHPIRRLAPGAGPHPRGLSHMNPMRQSPPRSDRHLRRRVVGMRRARRRRMQQLVVARTATRCPRPTPRRAPTTTPTTSGDCGRRAPRPHASGQFAQSFTFQGVGAHVSALRPAKYTGTKSVPVVFDFHGFGSNAVQQMVYGNFKPEADRDDFLIVAPDGQVPANRHFNLTGEKGLQNDVQMVGALLDHIEATFCVDTTRVYATGMSDGGAMTSVLACTMSNRFAAFGAVAVVVACGGNRPVPIMAIRRNRRSGRAVQRRQGELLRRWSRHRARPPSMTSWAKFDKLRDHVHRHRLSSEVTRRTWSGCAPGAQPSST